ncbi:MAG: hypothetical protein C4520_07070 [Candidatus Abyssobacteria bacterium SURF_5]|jgi:hypothetical protein|uniref:Uncharacterized protein n=1 Tax=Abyssobacteria bacterium (strain SURF_5) TaxID=2093360 RepID=A0A3A4P545_ABYX5|nr:MAG: hypothetical protein C4520_07070 [Candidatus Abyssubacteria bacterium SURF_5]
MSAAAVFANGSFAGHSRLALIGRRKKPLFSPGPIAGDNGSNLVPEENFRMNKLPDKRKISA